MSMSATHTPAQGLHVADGRRHPRPGAVPAAHFVGECVGPHAPGRHRAPEESPAERTLQDVAS